MSATPAKPAPPKRPLNATFSYKQEKFEAYSKANPGKKLPEITKDLCSQYSNLTAAEKKKYEDAYQANMAAYTKVECEVTTGQGGLRSQVREDRRQEEEEQEVCREEGEVGRQAKEEREEC